MIRRPPRSTQSRSSAASDVYKRQPREPPHGPLDGGLRAGQVDLDNLATGTVPGVGQVDADEHVAVSGVVGCHRVVPPGGVAEAEPERVGGRPPDALPRAVAIVDALVVA